MAMMMGNLYSALKQPGVDDDSARKAAQEVATYAVRMNTIDNRLSVLTWMVGFNLALSVAIVVKLFLPGAEGLR